MKNLWIWASLLTLTGYAGHPQPISSYFDKELFSEIELSIEEAKDEPLIVMAGEEWDFEEPMLFQSDSAKMGQNFPWSDEESTYDEYADLVEKQGSQDFQQTPPKKAQPAKEMAQFQPSFEQVPSKAHRFQEGLKPSDSPLSTKKTPPQKNDLLKQQNQPAVSKAQPLLQKPKAQLSSPSIQSVPKVNPKAPVKKKIAPSVQQPKNNPGTARENRKQMPTTQPHVQRKAPQAQAQRPLRRPATKKQGTRNYQRQKSARSEASLEE